LICLDSGFRRNDGSRQSRDSGTHVFPVPRRSSGNAPGRIEPLLAGFSQHEPHLLSAGQKQKVAIAGILAMKPKYLVLDEPTSMLDPSGRTGILKTLHQLNRDHGITVVHITHFTEEALEADRVVILDGGKIALQGAPKEILGDAGELIRSGLTIPPMVMLSDFLARFSVKVAQPVFKVEEMVEALCRSN